jgi:hypothetical protein
VSGTIYKTRELLEVARNAELKLTLCGIWYRNSPMEWVVFDGTIAVIHRPANYAAALALFERLVTDREVPA